MAEFIRAQIFGTTFEITSRYAPASFPAAKVLRSLQRHREVNKLPDTRTCNPWAWAPLAWSGKSKSSILTILNCTGKLSVLTFRSHSSARDQLTSQNVAVKKIMKPFSTPVLAKRTYRELKLLKHLRHENVSCRGPVSLDKE